MPALPRPPFRKISAACALALAATALLTGTAAARPTAVSAAPPATTDPAAGAAGWLARQLVDGNRLQSSYFDGASKTTVYYDDQGLTADAILAFAAARVAGTATDAATTWFAGQLDLYAGPASPTADETVYAGALAKAALIAEVVGRDPAAFGGRNLLTELAAREQGSTGTYPGRFSDENPNAAYGGDSSNAIGESLALIAEQRAGIGPDAGAIASLQSLQCPDGGFRVYYPVDPAAPDACVSDNDATAYAIQALHTVGAAAAAAVDQATGYLQAVQQADGSFQNAAYAGTPGVENANSTGLAAAALATAGVPTAAFSATGYLKSLQVSTTGPALGAITFDKSPFSQATAVRATTQAVLGLTGADLGVLTAAGSAGPAPILSTTPTPSTTTTSSNTSSTQLSPPTASSISPASSTTRSATSSSVRTTPTPQTTGATATSQTGSTSTPPRTTAGGPTSAVRTTTSTTTAVSGPTVGQAAVVAVPADVPAGGSTSLSVTGFQPGEQVRADLHSPVSVLATATADPSGAASISVIIPAGTSIGAHHLVVTGLTSGRSAATTVTVSAVLASTGAPIDPIATVTGGAALLLLGGGLVLFARRRVPGPRRR